MSQDKKMSTKYSRKTIIKFTITLWLIVMLFSSGTIIYFYMLSEGKLGFMPSFEQLENPKESLATKIYSADQKLLGTYFKENRSQTSYENLSPHLVDALIATEDIRYYDHFGIDFRALPRVATGVFSGGSKGGGSTITQQLAKMLFGRADNMSIFDLINFKFKEWIIAIKLEKSFTKEEIIEMYFNKFDFLNLAVGIESAARVYFNVTPSELTITESAMLVGMAQNPSLYNPLRFPEKTMHRRNVVLGQMLKYEYINQSEFDSLKLVPLGIKYQKVDHNIGSATYFREFLRLWLTAKKPIIDNYFDMRHYVEDSINWATDPSYGWCNKNTKPNGEAYNIYNDGLEIHTTLDSRMQKYAEEAVTEHIGGYIQGEFFKDQAYSKKAPFSNDLTTKQIDNIMKNSMKRSERWRILKEAGLSEEEITETFNIPTEMSVFSWSGDIDTVMTPFDSIRYNKFFLHAGFMSMEPNTGHVKAYIGGINYRHFKFDQATRARGQVGSTFNPFIYCLAMQNGYSPCTQIPNVEVTFKVPKYKDFEFYTPQYSESDYDGEMISLKLGLAKSLNQVSAWVLKQFSPEAAVSIAKKMGVNSHVDPYPSICVGAAEVLLSEMVGAYSVFANKGIYTKPVYITQIKDKNGEVLASFDPIQKEAISEETAYLMLDLMKGVVNMGTSIRLRYKYKLEGEMAGKTGTTNDHSDGWFIGMTPELVNGAWVGGEERSIRFRYIKHGQGASLALPIYGLFMQKVYADETLPYSTEKRFIKPNKLPVEIDCDKYNSNYQSIDNNF